MRTALFLKSGENMGNDTQKIKLLALWDILKRAKKNVRMLYYNRIDIRSSHSP